MKGKNTVVLILVLVVIVGGIFYLESQKVGGSGEGTFDIINPMSESEKEKIYSRAKEIDPTHGFINTEEISISELVGKKVILLDIWTYSCINCQRTFPYINQWYEKYKDQGLEIIAVHTPEFEFEKKRENVLAATKQFGLEYPVVLDNDYKTWNAYENRYWPRKYLIDIDGFIVYDHIGEGAYDETEKKIQELLEERAEKLGIEEDIITEITVPEGVETVSGGQRSPETYFGAWRNSFLGNGRQGEIGVQSFELPDGIKTHVQYFEGDWNIEQEYAESTAKGDKIVYRYQGETVNIVAEALDGVSMKILRDGEEVSTAAGEHVDENGNVQVKESILYRLINDPEGSGEHTLEIIADGPGLRVFAFTFG